MVNALHEARTLRFDTVQVFTKNQRQWKVPALKDEEREAWIAEVARLGWQGRPVAHNGYLVNLASPDDDLWEKSIALQREEIERCERLSIPFLVSHPGSHVGSGIEAGIARIAAACARLFRDTRGYRTMICLENTVGGGGSIGRTFEELARLRRRIEDAAGAAADQRIGYCIDTCHALAAGYDLSAYETPPQSPNGGAGEAPNAAKRRGSGAHHDKQSPAPRKRTRAEGEAAARAVLDELDSICGLANVRVWHLNDSKAPRGSRLDRHEHIGHGHVAIGAFAAIVNHPAFRSVPKILETPKEENEKGVPWDRVNLRRLKSLMSNRASRPATGASRPRARS